MVLDANKKLVHARYQMVEDAAARGAAESRCGCGTGWGVATRDASTAAATATGARSFSKSILSPAFTPTSGIWSSLPVSSGCHIKS